MSALSARDSPRWCAECHAWGDHHTDRHPRPAPRGTLKTRLVLLRVQNVAYMEHYHGREAGLIGEVVDAVELTTDAHVAYVDNRDGEAQELAEAVMHARAAGVRGSAYEQELETHAKNRFLHGVVEAIRR